MPRNRQIKVDFWGDEKIGNLSIPARLMFIGIWNFADDSGICRANPIYIKNHIFPYDNITIKKIHALLSECSQQGLITFLKYNKEQYLKVINFSKHQLINRPSKFRFIKDLSEAQEVLSERSLTNVGALKPNVNVNVNVNENNKERNIKERNANKKKYLDFVLLSDDEYKKLINKFGEAGTKQRIANLNNYAHQKWKKFKEYTSHYHTILAWENRNERQTGRSQSKAFEKTQRTGTDEKNYYEGL